MCSLIIDWATDRPGVHPATMRHACDSFPGMPHVVQCSVCAHTGPVFWNSVTAKSWLHYSGMMPCRRCINSSTMQRVLMPLEAHAFVWRQLVPPSSSNDQNTVLRLLSRGLCSVLASRTSRRNGAQGGGIITLSHSDGLVVVVSSLLSVTLRLDSNVRSQWSLVHASRATPLH